jgi:hypothetical protein
MLAGLGITAAVGLPVLLYLHRAGAGHGVLSRLLPALVALQIGFLAVAIGASIGAYQLMRDPAARTLANVATEVVAILLTGVWVWLWQVG